MEVSWVSSGRRGLKACTKVVKLIIIITLHQHHQNHNLPDRKGMRYASESQQTHWEQMITISISITISAHYHHHHHLHHQLPDRRVMHPDLNGITFLFTTTITTTFIITITTTFTITITTTFTITITISASPSVTRQESDALCIRISTERLRTDDVERVRDQPAPFKDHLL